MPKICNQFPHHPEIFFGPYLNRIVNISRRVLSIVQNLRFIEKSPPVDVNCGGAESTKHSNHTHTDPRYDTGIHNPAIVLVRHEQRLGRQFIVAIGALMRHLYRGPRTNIVHQLRLIASQYFGSPLGYFRQLSHILAHHNDLVQRFVRLVLIQIGYV